MLRDEACIHNAVHKVLNFQDHFVVLRRCGHSRDDELVQSTLHSCNCLRPVLPPDDELAKQGVIVGRHLALQTC